MIRVIRDDGIEILLNTKLIEKVEEDEKFKAVITLSTGEKIKVKTPVYDVIQKAKAYHYGISEERSEYDKTLEKSIKEMEMAAESEREKYKSLKTPPPPPPPQETGDEEGKFNIAQESSDQPQAQNQDINVKVEADEEDFEDEEEFDDEEAGEDEDEEDENADENEEEDNRPPAPQKRQWRRK